jgi:hypothetical protein
MLHALRGAAPAPLQAQLVEQWAQDVTVSARSMRTA